MLSYVAVYLRSSSLVHLRFIFVMEVLRCFCHSFPTTSGFSLPCLGTSYEVQHSVPSFLCAWRIKAQWWASWSVFCWEPDFHFSFDFFSLHWVRVSEITGGYWLEGNRLGFWSYANACYGKRDMVLTRKQWWWEISASLCILICTVLLNRELKDCCMNTMCCWTCWR